MGCPLPQWDVVAVPWAAPAGYTWLTFSGSHARSWALGGGCNVLGWRTLSAQVAQGEPACSA